ncbi:VOC family protein [Kroppenstedtia pulmonis]|uniref:VOC family protein n=1 Tax=Kroppenstedtia pulmonis TaxID=1380685 RepID=A0A7D3XR54_9BACL|nr:VOC family protein [Kroppenstedtia pulmonis]QKG84822.1 VOC family protein [Kroppenstedtia pulmonis]
MKRIVPHLMIENCKEAIAYYQELFGGEVKNIQLSDGIEMFKGQEGKYIHAELHVNEQCILYLADIFSQDRTKGSDVQLALELENEAEITRLFKGLSQGGKVKMELQDTFWGAKYAVVTDPYGITWELNAPQ